MRTVLAGIALSLTLVGSVAVADARAAGPDHKCYGQVVAGIASTWPWAHDDKVAFEPSPGSIALWIKTFGPDVGISSVRQLQLLFCSE